MQSPSPSTVVDRKTKRARRSSSRGVPSSASSNVSRGASPSSASTASAAHTAGDTPSKVTEGPSEGPRSVRGKRRRSVTSEFPLSFPRLDKASLPPPSRRHALIEADRYPKGDAASSYRRESRATCGDVKDDDIDIAASSAGTECAEASCLTAKNVAAVSASASVSARCLDELFFGASGVLAMGVRRDPGDGEASTSAEKVDVVLGRGRPGVEHDAAELLDLSHGDGKDGADDNERERDPDCCDLFEELLPSGMQCRPPSGTKDEESPSVVSSTAAAGIEGSTSTLLTAEPEEFTANDPVLMQANGTCQAREEDRDTERLGRGPKPEDDHVRGDSDNPAVKNARAQTASDGEVINGNRVVARTPIGARRSRRVIRTSGSGGCDSGSSSSVQETPSPKVCALETPPSSARGDRRHQVSPQTPHDVSDVHGSKSERPTALLPPPTRSMPPSLQSHAPAQFDAIIPNTQPTLLNVERNGDMSARATRRQSRGNGSAKQRRQSSAAEIDAAIPETQHSAVARHGDDDGDGQRTVPTDGTALHEMALEEKKRPHCEDAFRTKCRRTGLRSSTSLHENSLTESTVALGGEASAALIHRQGGMSGSVQAGNEQGEVGEDRAAKSVEVALDAPAIALSSSELDGTKSPVTPLLDEVSKIEAKLSSVSSPVETCPPLSPPSVSNSGSRASTATPTADISREDPADRDALSAESSALRNDATHLGTGGSIITADGDASVAVRPCPSEVSTHNAGPAYHKESDSKLQSGNERIKTRRRGSPEMDEVKGKMRASGDTTDVGAMSVAEVRRDGSDDDTRGDGPMTPARPRQLVEKFDDACRDDGGGAVVAPVVKAVESRRDDAVQIADEQSFDEFGSEAPSSGGLFDYSPVACSQAGGNEGTNQKGVTAAEMLAFNTDGSSNSPLDAPSGGASPASTKTSALPALAQTDALDRNCSSIQPSQPATPRVPNPYATGVGSLLTPHSKKTVARVLPASPFAAAAEAAAARRIAAAAAAKRASARAAAKASAEAAAAVSRGLTAVFATTNTKSTSAASSASAERVPSTPVHSTRAQAQHDTLPPMASGADEEGRCTEAAGKVKPAGSPIARRSASQVSALLIPRPTSTSDQDAVSAVSSKTEPPSGASGPSEQVERMGEDIASAKVDNDSEVVEKGQGGHPAVSAETNNNVKHLFREPGSSPTKSDGYTGAVSATDYPTGDASESRKASVPVTSLTSKHGRHTEDTGESSDAAPHDSIDSHGRAPTVVGPIDAVNTSRMGAVAFRTGCGRSLPVSAQAMARVQHLFDNHVGSPSGESTTAFDSASKSLTRNGLPHDRRGSGVTAVGKMVDGRGFGGDAKVGSPPTVRTARRHSTGLSMTGNASRKSIGAGKRGFNRPGVLAAALPSTAAAGKMDAHMTVDESVPNDPPRSGPHVPRSEGNRRGADTFSNSPPSIAATAAGAPAKFHTAKGRKIVVSDEAIARASAKFFESEVGKGSASGTMSDANAPTSGGSLDGAIIGARLNGSSNPSGGVLTEGYSAGSGAVLVGDRRGFGPQDGVGLAASAAGPKLDSNVRRKGEIAAQPLCRDSDGRAVQITGSRGPTIPAEAKERNSHLLEELALKADNVPWASSGGVPEQATRQTRPKPSEGSDGRITQLSDSPSLHTSGIGGGFRTARGRALTVSAEALAKINHLFENEDVSSNGNGSGGAGDSSHGSLFSTGKGKPIKVSTEALARADRMFGDSKPPDTDASAPSRSVVNPLGGSGGECIGEESSRGVPTFTTGKGRAVHVSPEALARAQKMFAEPSIPSEGPPADGRSGETAVLPVSGGTIPAPPHELKGFSITCPASAASDSEMVGGAGTDGSDIESKNAGAAVFTTGKGRVVHVSPEALARAEVLLEGSKASHAEPPASTRRSSETSGDGDADSSADGAIKRGGGGWHGDAHGAGPAVFTTGKGKAVHVSAEALARAQKLFNEPHLSSTGPSDEAARETIENGHQDDKHHATAATFTTGKGTAVRVSSEALARAEQMFGDTEKIFAGEAAELEMKDRVSKAVPGEGEGVDAGGKGTSGCSGSNGSRGSMFTTGMGRAVQVSPAALAQAKKMFAESETSRGETAGVEVGSGGVGGVNSQARSDDGHDGSSMFSTGKGRAVRVSQAALAEAHKMFAASEESHAKKSGVSLNVGNTAAEAVEQPLGMGGVFTPGRLSGTPHAMRSASPLVAAASSGPLRPRNHDFHQSGIGKENGGEELPQPRRRRHLGTPSRRAGILHGTLASTPTTPLANGDPSGARRGASLVSSEYDKINSTTGNAIFSTERPAAVLSSAKLANTMPPPLPSPGAGGAGMTPYSLGRPLARRSTPSSASTAAASPAGDCRRGSTPHSVRKRGLGYTGAAGIGRGLHSTKKLRSSPALGPVPSSSPSSLRAPLSIRGGTGTGNIGSGSGSSNGKIGQRRPFSRPSLAPRLLKNNPPVEAAPTPIGADVLSPHVKGEEVAIALVASASPPSLMGESRCHASRNLFGSLPIALEAATTGTVERKEVSGRKRQSLSSLRGPRSLGRLPRADSEVLQLHPQDSGEVFRDRKRDADGHDPTAIVTALLPRVTSLNGCDVRFALNGRPFSLGGSPPANITNVVGVAAGREGEPVDGGYSATPESASEQGRPGGPDTVGPIHGSGGTDFFRGELIQSGRNGELATPTWVENHLRWIVWKLAATERKFPEKFPMGYLNAERVGRQLRYRYDVELDHAKKPCLKAILQGDASAARPMVLCVSRVYEPQELGDRHHGAPAVIEVTDGWYPVDASLDEALAHFVRKGTIVPGTKLAICNAAVESGAGFRTAAAARHSTPATKPLGDGTSIPDGGSGGSGGGVGIDPLELLRRRSAGDLPPGAGPRLRLVVNSTRRARWASRLGFFRARPNGRGPPTEDPRAAQEEKSPLEVPLCTVVPGGGIVTATRVLILRRYPALYISSASTTGGAGTGTEGGRGDGGGGLSGGGPQLVLSEAEEEGERELHQARLQRAMEAAAAGVEEEVMEEVEEATPDLFRRMKEAENPASFLDELAPHERKEVLDWRDRQQQMMEALKQKAMDERLRDVEGADRRVRQLLTLRVACTCDHMSYEERAAGAKRQDREVDGRKAGRRHFLPPMVAVLKVWAPNEGTAALLTEGSELRLHSVKASPCHHHIPGCSLELSAGRQTKIEVIRPPSLSVPISATEALPATPAAAARTFVGGNVDVAACGQSLTNRPRYVPRFSTSLSTLHPCGVSAAVDTGGVLHGGAGNVASSDQPLVLAERRSSFTGHDRPLDAGSDGSSVDLVGCLFAITKESSSSDTCGGDETVIDTTDAETSSTTRDGPVRQAVPPMEDADTCATSATVDRTGVRERDGYPSGTEKEPRRGAAKRFPNFVVYRIYLTDPAGWCVRVEKRIRPSLVRHHRILRAAPGTCWAIMNGERPQSLWRGDQRKVVRDTLATPCRGNASSTRNDNSLPWQTGFAGNSTHGAATVNWSSMTAVGGSGAATPRLLAGAPAAHLGQPLQKLRKWADCVEGKNAVHRERQRLILLLAKKRHVEDVAASATVAAPVPVTMAVAASRDVDTVPPGAGHGNPPTIDGSENGGGDPIGGGSFDLEKESRAVRDCNAQEQQGHGDGTSCVTGFVLSFALDEVPRANAWREVAYGSRHENVSCDGDVTGHASERVSQGNRKCEINRGGNMMRVWVDTGERAVAVRLQTVQLLKDISNLVLSKASCTSLASRWFRAATAQKEGLISGCVTTDAEQMAGRRLMGEGTEDGAAPRGEAEVSLPRQVDREGVALTDASMIAKEGNLGTALPSSCVPDAPTVSSGTRVITSEATAMERIRSEERRTSAKAALRTVPTVSDMKKTIDTLAAAVEKAASKRETPSSGCSFCCPVGSGNGDGGCSSAVSSTASATTQAPGSLSLDPRAAESHAKGAVHDTIESASGTRTRGELVLPSSEPESNLDPANVAHGAVIASNDDSNGGEGDDCDGRRDSDRRVEDDFCRQAMLGAPAVESLPPAIRNMTSTSISNLGSGNGVTAVTKKDSNPAELPSADTTLAAFCGCPGSIGAFLGELAAACGGRQLAFSTDHCPGGELLVKSVASVDAAQGANDLLRDLVACYPSSS